MMFISAVLELCLLSSFMLVESTSSRCVLPEASMLISNAFGGPPFCARNYGKYLFTSALKRGRILFMRRETVKINHFKINANVKL